MKKYAKKRTYKKVGMKKYVNRAITKALNSNIEKKYHDLWNVGGVSSTTALNKLTAIPQGTTDFNRIGDQCKLKNIQMRFQLACADTIQTYRLTVFRWNRDDAVSTPTAAILYQTIGSSISSNPNWDNIRKGDFTLLYDKVITQTLANNANTFIKVFRKINSRIDFNGSGNTGKGHIYIAMTSDSGVASHPVIDQYSRVVFTDA